MKKVLCSIALCSLALVVSGCGNSNKLVCTSEEDGNKVETTITFKGDTATKIVSKMTFESEEYAQLAAAFLKIAESQYEGLKTEQKGKVVTVSADSKDYLEGELGENLTKSEIKKSLEDDGYKCK